MTEADTLRKPRPLNLTTKGLPVQVQVLKRFRWGDGPQGPWSRVFEVGEILILDEEQLHLLTEKTRYVTRNF